MATRSRIFFAILVFGLGCLAIAVLLCHTASRKRHGTPTVNQGTAAPSSPVLGSPSKGQSPSASERASVTASPIQIPRTSPNCATNAPISLPSTPPAPKAPTDRTALLVGELVNGSREQSLRAAEALLDSDSEESFYQLFSHFELIESDDIRRDVEALILQHPFDDHSEFLMDMMWALTNSQSQFVAQQVFARSLDTNKLGIVLDKYLASDDTQERSQFANSLRLLTNEDALPLVCSVANAAIGFEHNDDLAWASVDAIASIGTPDAIRFLVDGAADEQPSVRNVYISAICRCSNPKSEETLIAMSQDHGNLSKEIRTAVITGLGNYDSDRVKQTLNDVLKTETDTHLRDAAQQSLNKIDGISNSE